MQQRKYYYFAEVNPPGTFQTTSFLFSTVSMDIEALSSVLLLQNESHLRETVHIQIQSSFQLPECLDHSSGKQSGLYLQRGSQSHSLYILRTVVLISVYKAHFITSTFLNCLQVIIENNFWVMIGSCYFHPYHGVR